MSGDNNQESPHQSNQIAYYPVLSFKQKQSSAQHIRNILVSLNEESEEAIKSQQESPIDHGS